MKKMLFLLLIAGFFTACTSANTETEETQTSTTEETAADVDLPKVWDEQQEAFHDVMSNTFHPAEEGNLEPIKTRHKELAAAAATWAKLPVPAKYSNEQLPDLMQKLATETQAFSEKMEAGLDDAAIKDGIFALHDVFHGVVGACEDHEHDHGHDH